MANKNENYFKVGNTDFSQLVNELKVKRQANYNAQTNAAGDTVIDFINYKYTVTVGFIPMHDEDLVHLKVALSNLASTITFSNPFAPNGTGLPTTITCILPEWEPEVYHISDSRIYYKAFTLEFTQL